LRAERHEVIERLMTIPGIGLVCATTLYATIGKIERFPNANRLAAYVGLVPTVRNSGDSTMHGHITKQGSGPLRATLVQSANIIVRPAMRNAEPIQAVYNRIRGTRGRRKIALVAEERGAHSGGLQPHSGHTGPSQNCSRRSGSPPSSHRLPCLA
ncbi:MAG: IS110 family transposase, partial [bacterium]|nr:IS110 family transposase [bacterium]